MMTGVTVAAATVMLLAGCAGSDSGNDAAAGSSSTPAPTSSSGDTSATTSSVDCSDPDLSQAEWTQNCGPDASPGAGDAAPATSPSYDDPADMMDKAAAKLPYLACDDETSDYDIYGGLGITCTGRQSEGVTFDVYKTNGELLSALESLSEANPGTEYYAGENWAVGATNKRTLADLQRVLDPKNAPKVETLTKSEAKAEYRRMVEPVNETVTDVDWLSDSSDLSDYTSACSDSESVMGVLADELEFAAWPSDIDTEIAALVKDVKSDEAIWKECADATSVADANAAMDKLNQDQTAANDVRSALGLDAAPTN